MSRYRRADTPGASYFFTLVAYRRRPILCDEVIRDALRGAIATVRIARPFIIDAWVLLPDHLHCIWTLPDGDADFSTRWMMIKREVSRNCRDGYRHAELLTESKRRQRESTIWQRRFWEHRLRDEDDFMRHADYIHFNPLKHGVTKSVADWPYSTFHRHVREGIYAKDWAGAGDRAVVEYDD